MDRWDIIQVNVLVRLASHRSLDPALGRRRRIQADSLVFTGKPKDQPDLSGAPPVAQPSAPKPFIFLDVSILREYLSIELSAIVHSFPFSLERAIDDWVFLIFFVGNDFLPHLPSLEIREGAIDTLMGIWKGSLERMGGYLAEHGKVNLARAQVILDQLAEREDEIFRKRREGESSFGRDRRGAGMGC